MKSKYDGFIFDMDGVLFDTQVIYNRSYLSAADELGIKDAGNLVKKTTGLNIEMTKAAYIDACGEDFDFESFNNLAVKNYYDILRDEGLKVKHGVYELLDYLNKSNCRMAVASSTHRDMVLEHLRKAGIDGYFHAVVGGDMVKNGKPAPDVYIEACKRLNIMPERAVAFEDSPNGLKSAKSAGLKTVMIPDGIPYSDGLAGYVSAWYKSLAEVQSAIQNMVF